MKRLLAMILAAMLMITMAVPAFAATPAEDVLESLSNLTMFYVGGDAYPTIVSNQITFTPGKTGYLSLLPVGTPSSVVNNFDEYLELTAKKNKGKAVISSMKKADSYRIIVNGATDEEVSIQTPGIIVNFKDNYTDAEEGFSFDLTLKMKKDAWIIDGTPYFYESKAKADADALPMDTVIALPKGTKFTWETNKHFLSNLKADGDGSLPVGFHGIVLKPIKNDENTVEWEDANNTIATLKFNSDDSASKYYPKLKTSWDNADYMEAFADTDAFVFEFVAAPNVGTTSRATLELYNPFVDDEGDSLVDGSDVIIYERDADGTLTDVTKNFTFTTNDEGEDVFQTKTRKLGTYILAADAAVVAQAKEAAEESQTGKPTGVYFK